MTDTNSVIIIGRLTRDCQAGASSSGTGYAKFAVAVNGRKEGEVSFFDVVCFGRTAEALAKYLLKGKQVCVEGSLFQSKYRTREWESRTSVEIHANRIQLLGGGGNNGGGGKGYPEEW